MKKSIAWRIKHAERKIKEGKKVNRFTPLLHGLKKAREDEIRGGFKYEHRPGNKELGKGQAYIKVYD